MGAESQIGTLIGIITALTTYQGLKHSSYQEKYLFHSEKILLGKEYYRLVTSGFLHVNWLHFGLNMLALISFALSIEVMLGIKSFLLIYFLSMLGGSLLALYIHRNHYDYTAVGASGAISGVIASSIILFPESEIGLILIPGGIKSWIFGLVFILISILGIKSQSDNIGHEAHLGGILTGIVVTSIISPTVFFMNWYIALGMAVPIILFIYLIVNRPDILITGKWNLESPKLMSKRNPEISLDEILEKINKKGVEGLSKKEKKLLDKYSNQK